MFGVAHVCFFLGRYCEYTRDAALFGEWAPYLEGPPCVRRRVVNAAGVKKPPEDLRRVPLPGAGAREGDVLRHHHQPPTCTRGGSYP